MSGTGGGPSSSSSSPSATATTTSSASRPPRALPNPTAPGTSSSSAYRTASSFGAAFTPRMRDRQARGKDPVDDDDSDEGRMRLDADFVQSESYVIVERRNFAASVLDSPELLMMHAQSSGDSIPATRLKFMRMLCGYDTPPADRERMSRR